MDLAIHKKLQELAKSKIINERIELSVDDIVNEAYLLVLEEGKELTLENLRKKLNNVSLSALNKSTEKHETFIDNTESKVCKRCKEDKPIGCFGITTRRDTGKRVIQTYCSSCQSEVMAEIRSKNKTSVSNYNKARIQSITDTYVVNVMKSRRRLLTKQDIEEKRQTILKERQGIKGVSKRGSKFHSRISIHGKVIYLGSYSTKEDAHKAYKEAREGVLGRPNGKT